MKTNQRSGEYPRWTLGTVILKKPLKFTALTLLLTAALVVLLDPVLTLLIRSMGIKSNAIGGVFFFLLLALAALAAAALLTALSNLRLASLPPEEAQALFEKQSHFFWSRMYSLVIGYLSLMPLFTLSNKALHAVEARCNALLSFFACFACLILPLLAAYLFANGLNWVMIRLTGTNKALIDGFRAGQYMAQIPEPYRDEQSLRGILQVLERAEAGSVRGAVLVYRFKTALHTFYKKLSKVLGKCAIVVIVIGVILGMGVSAPIEREMNANRAARKQAWEREDFARSVSQKLEGPMKSSIKTAVNKEFSRFR